MEKDFEVVILIRSHKGLTKRQKQDARRRCGWSFVIKAMVKDGVPPLPEKERTR